MGRLTKQPRACANALKGRTNRIVWALKANSLCARLLTAKTALGEGAATACAAIAILAARLALCGGLAERDAFAASPITATTRATSRIVVAILGDRAVAADKRVEKFEIGVDARGNPRCIAKSEVGLWIRCCALDHGAYAEDRQDAVDIVKRGAARITVTNALLGGAIPMAKRTRTDLIKRDIGSLLACCGDALWLCLGQAVANELEVLSQPRLIDRFTVDRQQRDIRDGLFEDDHSDIIIGVLAHGDASAITRMGMCRLKFVVARLKTRPVGFGAIHAEGVGGKIRRCDAFHTVCCGHNQARRDQRSRTKGAVAIVA